jgi:hypothetical protein
MANSILVVYRFWKDRKVTEHVFSTYEGGHPQNRTKMTSDEDWDGSEAHHQLSL